jgi:hypothetical protein
MSKTTKILRTLVVVGVVGSIAALGVFSAFSSQTDNPGNEVKAGTVTLADNDAGSAAYNIQNAKPGDTDEACIKVTYTGSLDATVKLYTTATSVADLGPHVNLEITPGTQVTPNLDCTGFVPDVSGAIFNNTLENFQSTHNAFSNGLADNPGAVATKWVANDAVVYRVKATLASNAPDSAQGDTTGVHTIRWGAQNQ